MLATLLLLASLSPFVSTDEWAKTFEVTGQPELRVVSGDGNIRVIPWDKNAIDARVITNNWKIGEGGIKIYDRQNGDTVDIELKFPDRMFQLNWRDRRVDIEIRMPRAARLNLRTGDGRIELSGIKGEIVLHTGDGNLELAELEGMLRATTGDGHIKLRKVKGDMTIGTGDGGIDIDDADGALRIRTGDGRVRVNGRFQSLEIKTDDGGIDAVAMAGSRMESNWTLSTGDGTLTLRVPADLAADVDLHTNDGHIDLQVPVTISGRADNRTIRGQINGGGKLLTLRTGDGSIRMEKH